MTKNWIKQFDEVYNTDGCGKALVIIEDREDGGTTQRPAQDEIKKFIKEQIMGIEKIHQDEVIGLLDDMRKQAERADDHYASQLAWIQKEFKKWLYSKGTEDIEEAMERILGMKLD